MSRVGLPLGCRQLRALVTIAALALLLSLLSLASVAADQQEREVDVVAARVDGVDRIDTAAQLAELTYEPRPETTTALVAHGGDFPDALSAAALSGTVDGPVLLTWRDEVPERLHDVLEGLEVDELVLLGGEGAISATVEEELAQDRPVERIAGEDRFATATAVARTLAETSGIGEVDGDRTVLLASGQDFADALTAGPLAHRGGHPLLLTAQDHLPPATASFLDEGNVDRAIVLGGESAISAAVLDEVTDRGVQVERIAGPERTATAAAFAGMLTERFGFGVDEVLLARGDDFPDALAAGPRGGVRATPILLTSTPGILGAPATGWLEARCPRVEVVRAAGGDAAVTHDALGDAVTAAEACAEPDPLLTLTYQTGTRGEVHGDLDELRRIAADGLNDDRGWSLGGDITFTEVADGGDFRLWLASPQAVAGAHEVCSPQWSCRVGDDVYINDENWRESTATYREAGRSLEEYRVYVVNHEVGHWLGHPDYDHTCDSPDQPAPVMNQQSIDLQGCATNLWPLQWERDLVREWWLE